MKDRQEEIVARPIINQGLPDFAMEVYHDKKQKTISLSEFRGRWLVLIFYPADFTFVCPTELAETAQLYSEFQKAGAEVISISTDTVYTHKAWHDQSSVVNQVKFPMAADPAGRLSRLMGVYLEDEGLALRGSFIVDPDGIVKAAEVNDNNIGRSASELLRKLQAAKAVRENGGTMVCPASWKPGDAMITIPNS